MNANPDDLLIHKHKCFQHVQCKCKITNTDKTKVLIRINYQNCEDYTI